VICPVLELREEKRTFVKIGGGKVDFFLQHFIPFVSYYQSERSACEPTAITCRYQRPSPPDLLYIFVWAA
jgi:hypothetical protein